MCHPDQAQSIYTSYRRLIFGVYEKKKGGEAGSGCPFPFAWPFVCGKVRPFFIYRSHAPARCRPFSFLGRAASWLVLFHILKYAEKTNHVFIHISRYTPILFFWLYHISKYTYKRYADSIIFWNTIINELRMILYFKIGY